MITIKNTYNEMMKIYAVAVTEVTENGTRTNMRTGKDFKEVYAKATEGFKVENATNTYKVNKKGVWTTVDKF